MTLAPTEASRLLAALRRMGLLEADETPVLTQLTGGVSSLIYAITYGEKSFSSWAPLMWPIKMIMTIGLILMLLQFIANFFRDIAAARGKTI